MRRAVLLALLSLAAGPLLRGEEWPSPAGLLGLSVRSPRERAGDYDALAAEWLAAIRAFLSGESLGESLVPDELALELVLRRLGEVRPHLADPARLIPELEALSRLRYPDGLYRHILRGLLDDFYRAAGREGDGRALWEGQGFLRRWAIIGPFGLGGPSQLRRAFPPEREIDAGTSYPGRKGPVQWRVPPRPDSSRPHLFPARWIYPNQGVVYLLAQARAERELEAVLHLSGREPVVAWVNDRLLFREDPDSSQARRRASGMRLAQGVNRILLKTWARPDSWLRVWISGPDGDVLEGLSLDEPLGAQGSPGGDGAVRPLFQPLAASAPSPLWPGPFRSGAVAAWEALAGALEARGAPPAQEAEARIGLALLLSESGNLERAVLHSERALELASDSWLAAHAGKVLLAARYLPRDHARSRARAAFEAALRADPDNLPAYLPLSRLSLEDNEVSRAAERLQAAISKRPGFLAARLELLSLYESRAWDAEAEAEAAEVEALAPRSAAPAHYRSLWYRVRSNPARALLEARSAISRDHGQREVYGEIAELLEETGDAAGAEEALLASRALDPEDPAPARALAAFHERRREWDRAIEIQAEMDAWNPADPSPAAAMGRLHERAGRLEEARAWYGRALRREPGDIALSRYMLQLEDPSKRDEFWRDYDESLEEWLPRIPPPERVPGSSAVAVLDIAVLKLYPDGSSSEYTHQAFRLLSEKAKDDLASVSTPGEILTLRTVTADGQTLEPVAATGKWAFTMPRVAPGATVEIAYRVDHPRADGWMQSRGFFFQDFEYQKPFLLSRYAVLIPPGLKVDLVERAMKEAASGAAGKPRVRREERSLPGGGRAVVYEAREVPRLEREIYMPHHQDYLPNVELTEKRSWDDVASRLEDTVLGLARPTPELARAAAKATRGVEGALEKARAIYAHVNDLVAERSLATEAVQVLISRAGNRTILLKALLDAAGVPNRWAFLRPRESLLPRDDGAHPTPEAFSELYVLVEPPGAPPVWLSLAIRRAPFGKLPSRLEGGTALVLDPEGGGRLWPVPAQPVEDSASSTFMEVALSGEDLPDLSVRARVTMLSRSVEYYEAKERFRTQKEDLNRQAFSTAAARFFPGARLLSGDLPGLADPESPLTVRIELEAPRVLTRRGEEEILLRPVLSPVEMVKRFVNRPRRDHPYRLSRDVVLRDRARLSSGPRFRFARLPDRVTLASPIGTYSLSFTPGPPGEDGGETLTVERHLTLLPATLEPEEFARVVEFAHAVDRAEEERLVLK